MAFGVLAANQPPTAKPSEFLPKDLALRLVRRGWAERIGRELIHRRSHRAPVTAAEMLEERRVYGMPDRISDEEMIRARQIPPEEVAGCHFQEPQSATWREQHRCVSFAEGGRGDCQSGPAVTKAAGF